MLCWETFGPSICVLLLGGCSDLALRSNPRDLVIVDGEHLREPIFDHIWRCSGLHVSTFFLLCYLNASWLTLKTYAQQGSPVSMEFCLIHSEKTTTYGRYYKWWAEKVKAEKSNVCSLLMWTRWCLGFIYRECKPRLALDMHVNARSEYMYLELIACDWISQIGF